MISGYLAAVSGGETSFLCDLLFSPAHSVEFFFCLVADSLFFLSIVFLVNFIVII